MAVDIAIQTDAIKCRGKYFIFVTIQVLSSVHIVVIASFCVLAKVNNSMINHISIIFIIQYAR